MNTEFNNAIKSFSESRSQAFLNSVSGEITNVAKSEVPVRTGALKESINWQVFSKLWNKIGSDLHYAYYVEHGTVKMAPRPFLRNAARAVLGKYR